jgi:SAM-dependent methyltransferase
MSQSPEIPFELDSLANARNYQQWVFESVRPCLGRRILEVGSGIGNMSQWLPAAELLILTETDPALLEILRARAPEYFGARVPNVRITALDLSRHVTDPAQAASLAGHDLDTVVSFNVLEHIEDDRAAIGFLLDLLRASPAPVRRLISFVPAQAWALSRLDRYYGHFRRYSRGRVLEISRALAPEAELSVTPFNALGLLGWVWSTMILKRTKIDPASVKAYDAICPYTKAADNFVCRTLKYPLGQSFVWVLTLRR